MREALDLARKGRSLASPNPMVGAILVREGEVVGRGFHTYAGLHHAEIIALAQAGDKARGATLYLNLEPCSHQGRTPPCADALILAGVARVVAACRGPQPARRRRRLPPNSARPASKSKSPPSSPPKPRSSTSRSSTSCAPAAPWSPSKPPSRSTAKSPRPTTIAAGSPASAPAPTCSNSATITTPSSPASAPCWPTICLLTDRTGLPRCRPLLRIVHGFPAAPPARFQNGAQRAAAICSSSPPRAASAERRKLLESPRRAGARVRWPRRPRRPARRGRLAGPPAVSLAHDRGRQQAQLERRSNRAWWTAFSSTTAPKS